METHNGVVVNPCVRELIAEMKEIVGDKALGSRVLYMAEDVYRKLRMEVADLMSPQKNARNTFRVYVYDGLTIIRTDMLPEGNVALLHSRFDH